MSSEPIVIRVPRPIANAILLIAVVVGAFLAASLVTRDPGAADAYADRYLSALVRGDAEAAWPLLTHRVQTIWGSFENFEEAVHRSDWSTFEYEILETFCDDNICAVQLQIPNGVDSVPRMLYEGPTHYWWGSADTLLFSDKFITGAADEARRRGDKQARIVVIYGEDSGIA